MKRIDVETWSRREPYRYFSAMDNPYWGLTCEFCASRVRRYMKENAIPAYVGMIYLVTKALNTVPELRLRIQDDGVYDYDVVHPSFTILNKDKQLRFGQSAYAPDAADFIARTSAIKEEIAKAKEHVLAAKSYDLIYLSCLPWVHFSGMTHAIHFKPQDSIPRVAWGKFEEKGKDVVLAMNIQVHHGLADGYHVSQFMQQASAFCAEPESCFEHGAQP